MYIQFPGMDPYLEHPALWPDVHNSLIAAIREYVAPRIAPKYYVALESRTFAISDDTLAFIGRPDVAVVKEAVAAYETETPPVLQQADVEPSDPPATDEPHPDTVTVQVPMPIEVSEHYLSVVEVDSHDVVTVLELLSPTNKRPGEGRERYLEKRRDILGSRTNLVEIDLLRDGVRMDLLGQAPESDYSILVSRAWQRPNAKLLPFGLRQAIPKFPLPLRRDDEEPSVALNSIVHSLYERARFDLRINYENPPVPPLSRDEAKWAKTLPREAL